jgi:hypothetical protein
MVPGLNDDECTVAAIGRTVGSLGLARIDVLPYHRAGIAKYVRLDEEYRLPDTNPGWMMPARPACPPVQSVILPSARRSNAPTRL